MMKLVECKENELVISNENEMDKLRDKALITMTNPAFAFLDDHDQISNMTKSPKSVFL